MKRYHYVAKDLATGKKTQGEAQADSVNDAVKLLVKQGFTPLDIKEQDENSSFFSSISGRIRAKDKIVFSRQLATLLGAGLPLSQSLHTVAQQTENTKLRKVVEEIITDIEGGKSLHDSFAKHPTVFSKVFLALVEAGEASGTLDDALKRIASQQEKDAEVVSKIRGAMVYPMIVLVVIGLVIVFMMLTVVPQVEQLYEDLHKPLPLLTKIMVDGASFMRSYWYVVVLVLLASGYFFWQWLKTEGGIKFKDSFKLNVPLFGILFRKLYMARFARTGQTLLKVGVPMLDMLRITGEAVNNTILELAITRASDKVKSGKPLSKSIEGEDYFMVLVPQMINIGEQSGKVDEMLGKVAQVYEDELDEQIRTISTLIEPVLMVVLAIVAGGMVGAILFPIYSLVGGVKI
ncbi:type II secretion system F family protein [Candidatus Saccharibacteria bacterium]|nr:type II secretion system F family protein [Candidatus Saccharibacteria bacterium]